MNTQSKQKLFTPLRVGTLTLEHRVVLPPLTRMRSEMPGAIPGDLMVEYYTQRASEGGLLIAEATAVAVTGNNYLGAPGIYTDEQAAGWRKVTDAVHDKGGHFFLQLWHGGRVGHVELTGGATPVGPSVITIEALSFTSKGWVPISQNRALEPDEIPGIVEQFRRAAERAQAAGFDGVEFHAANGYLFDQFLQDGTNQRTDAYGGPAQNRARLLLEAVDAAVSVWGGSRVAVRISPGSLFHGMSDSDPAATFGYLAGQLNRFGLAYLHVIEPRVNGSQEVAEGLQPVATGMLRHLFKGPLIAAGGFDPGSAAAILEKGEADMVAFGRHFIANPDLPERIRRCLPLNAYDRSTFYGGDARGYTDYPFYQATAAEITQRAC